MAEYAITLAVTSTCKQEQLQAVGNSSCVQKKNKTLGRQVELESMINPSSQLHELWI